MKGVFPPTVLLFNPQTRNAKSHFFAVNFWSQDLRERFARISCEEPSSSYCCEYYLVVNARKFGRNIEKACVDKWLIRELVLSPKLTIEIRWNPPDTGSLAGESFQVTDVRCYAPCLKL